MDIKIEQMNIDTFWNQFFFGVNRLFVLVYTNQDNASKRFKTGRYYLPKGIIENYVIINGKKNYDQLIDLDIAVDLSRKRIRSRSRYNSTNRNL